ncbi:hypothetical protein [Methanolapillus ohkumae]|uniref:Uncharacterized protein n=1 Tax=Methanolapillus ohkumae TaxID=3028298 RepID=A0AA96V7J8_9EURY|nr:hypothetical protein MsAm2_14160 [Methanosarcinaceae archaeon Am2]
MTMTSANKKIILLSVTAVLLILIVAAIAVIYLNEMNKDVVAVEINFLPEDSVIDIYNPAELVGAVDYVFVGNVDELIGTNYRPVAVIDGMGWSETIEDPFTNYTVTVLDNIKGDLVLNQQVSVLKDGGLSRDGKTLTLYVNDSLPEPGSIYVFYIYAQPDGKLLASGSQSTQKIQTTDVSDLSQIQADPVYLKAVNGFENQIVQNRTYYVGPIGN